MPVYSFLQSRCGASPCASFQYLIVLFSLLLPSQWAFADAPDALVEPRQWLEKMSSALQSLNYQGVFVYRQQNELSAMRVTHLADAAGEHELLETLTGEAREVVRNSSHFRGLIADSQSGKETGTEGHLTNIENYYDLKMAGRDRAAGRMSQMITVMPKDKLRYGYRLWLDEKTALLLKSDLIDEQQQVLEQVMFTSMQILTDDDRKRILGNSQQAAPASKVKKEDLQTSSRAWTVKAMPNGFTLIDSRSQAADGGAEQMVFTDGLASISVFVEPSKGDFIEFQGITSVS